VSLEELFSRRQGSHDPEEGSHPFAAETSIAGSTLNFCSAPRIGKFHLPARRKTEKPGGAWFLLVL